MKSKHRKNQSLAYMHILYITTLILINLVVYVGASQEGSLAHYIETIRGGVERTQHRDSKFKLRDAQEEDMGTQNKRELAVACPSTIFQESYLTQYNNASFVVQPLVTMTCSGTIFGLKSVIIADGGVPSAGIAPATDLANSFYYSYNNGLNSIEVSNWTTLQNNWYYNVTLFFTFGDLVTGTQTVFTEASFFVVIGSVPLQYSPIGQLNYNYKQSVSFGYQTAFDPTQPVSGVLTAFWQCSPLFFGCQNLQIGNNQFTPVQLINVNRIVFNTPYQFNVTLTNPTGKSLKSVTDSFTFTVSSPELTEAPITCLNFTVNLKNQSMPLYNYTATSKTFMFVSGNYSSIVISSASINITNCVKSYGSVISAITFTSFNNPYLFLDIHSYDFNSTAITIPQAGIQAALAQQPQTSITSYAYLFNPSSNSLLGYQYMQIIEEVGDQTLYAQTGATFAQVDYSKVLYIDGSESYDTTNVATFSLNYQWTIDGFPSITLPNQQILTLTPDFRTQNGINTPGMYYNYTLRVSAGSRLSFPVKVLVQISPGLDPNQCVNVSLKNINVTSIITYTIFPLLLQAVVTKNAQCPGLQMESLVWSSSSVNWIFWQTVGNNNTIGMDRSSLQLLPASKDVSLTVTQYYKLYNIEYISQLSFVLLVQEPNLVAIVNYPTVLNPRTTSYLTLDGSGSYDPQAAQANTENVPIQCSWTCPSTFSALCSSGSTLKSNGGCTLAIPTQSILVNPNYNQSIAGQMFLFTLTISKDTRQTVNNVFVTIVDNDYYPKCSIIVQSPYQNTINQYQWITAQCNNTISSDPTRYGYYWSIFQWTNQMSIPETSQLIINQQSLRIPPYLLGGYSQLFIQVQVTADTLHTTPIGIYYQSNVQSYFTQGTINMNFNSFTAYLSNFVMTPQGWDSSLSSFLTFQYRMKDSFQSYRVLLSPIQASTTQPISTILPPITYEQAIYIDVIDSLGNYITIRQPIISSLTTLMTATQFAIGINGVVQTVSYSFTEQAFEQNFYLLRQYYSAYMNGQMDYQGMPTQFFATLAQTTIQYMYNTIMIDKRLSQVQSFDRLLMINQHTIEIIHAMSQPLKNQIAPLNLQQAVTLVNNALQSGNFSIGTSYPDICSKIFQITVQSIDLMSSYQVNGTSNIFDQLTLSLVKNMQQFLYVGEELQSTTGIDFSFYVIKLSSSYSSMLSLSTFSYDQTEVYNKMSSPQGGMMVLARNDTYVFVQLYDPGLNLVTVSLLITPVSITFTMPSNILTQYVNNSIQLQCASRNTFALPWTSTRINITSVNNQTGQVVCQASHFTQYTLFMIPVIVANPIQIQPGTNSSSNTTYIDPTKIKNTTTNGTNNVPTGSWNTTFTNNTNGTIINNVSLPVVSVAEQPLIFQEKSQTMYLIAIFTLVLFIITHYFFRIKYKAEHNDQPQKDFKHRFIYSHSSGRCNNLFRLYGLIMVNFNPYLNLFCVYNKFLPRWIRNLMIQIFFMLISIGFGINQSLLSAGMTSLNTSSLQIALFFIITVGAIILRPIGIKILYMFLYEPYSRVEDYKETDSHNIMKSANQSQSQRIELEAAHALQDFVDQPIEHFPKQSTQSGKKLSDIDLVHQSSIGNEKHDFNGPSVQHQNSNKLQKNPTNDDIIDLEDYPGAPKPTSFLPSIGLPQVFGAPSEPDQKSSLPELRPHIRGGFKEMANAFDEFDEKAKAIMEGELHRSDHEEDFGMNDEPPMVVPSQKRKIAKKKKKAFQMSDLDHIPQAPKAPEPPSQKVLSLIEKNELERKKRLANIFQENARQMVNNLDYNDDAPPIEVANRSEEARKSLQKQPSLGGYNQFYAQQNQDESSDHRELDDDFNHQLEGGEIEEEIKQVNPQDFMKPHFNERSLDRGEIESMGDDLIQKPMDSPLTGYNSNIEKQGPNSDHGEKIINVSSPNIIKQYQNNEHSMNLTHSNHSGDSLQSPDREPSETNKDKKIYVWKQFGKVFVAMIWAGLIVANMLCLIRMDDDNFSAWAILSCASFASILLIVDPILYLMLAVLMLKKESSAFQKINEFNNENQVEYFTDSNKSGCCSRLFVVLMIGTEKMKDLKRRLNPYKPV